MNARNNAVTPIIERNEYERLLVNAVKNSKEAGAKEVTIDIDNANVLIVDNGPGFPPAVLESFKRKEPMTTKREGSGLGLVQMESFCKRLGWGIAIGNRKDKTGAIILLETKPKKISKAG